MILPAPNIGSQIERALIALFYSNWPTTVLPLPKFYFSNDWKDRVPPLIDVLAHKSIEKPDFSADEDYMVRICAKWPGANQPGQQNLDFNWNQINQLIGSCDAALRQTVLNAGNYEVSAWKLSAAGRRLAVFGLASVQAGPTAVAAVDLANNADMATFICDSVQFKGSARAGKDSSTDSVILAEERNWLIRGYNNSDNSIFPALTFDGEDTLNWTFTVGGILGVLGDEPANWMVEKSVDGKTWIVQEVLTSGARTANIAGTGTQYWRVCRSDDGENELDPESNCVAATAS